MTQRFIGKYEIISTLGRGSMGVVYKARDPEIGRLVAIKTLRASWLQEDNDNAREALARFKQESQSAGNLRHPVIVMIYEASRAADDTPFIVMEYIDGKSLESIVLDRGPLPPTEAIHYLALIASALDYAHTEKVIHRDIKPSNVLIDTRRMPHLLDFGVAKLSDSSLTPPGTVVGTPSYMAPEQIRGEELDGRADIFSFTVMAFELLTGSRPFPGKKFAEVVGKIIHDEPVTFEYLGISLPEAVEEILYKGMLKEREQRYDTAFEIASGLADSFGLKIDRQGLIGDMWDETEQLETETIAVESLKDEVSLEPDTREEGAALTGVHPIVGREESFDETLDQRVEALVNDDLFSEIEERTADDLYAEDEGESDEINFGTKVFYSVVLIFALFFAIGMLYPNLIQKIFKKSSDFVVPHDIAVPDIFRKKKNISAKAINLDNPDSLSDTELSAAILSGKMSAEKKKEAIKIAGSRGSKELKEALFSLYSDTNEVFTKVWIIKSISKSSYAESGQSQELMKTGLKDNDPVVRGFAAKAIGHWKIKNGKQLLKERLKSEKDKLVQKVIRNQLKR